MSNILEQSIRRDISSIPLFSLHWWSLGNFIIASFFFFLFLYYFDLALFFFLNPYLCLSVFVPHHCLLFHICLCVCNCAHIYFFSSIVHFKISVGEACVSLLFYNLVLVTYVALGRWTLVLKFQFDLRACFG